MTFKLYKNKETGEEVKAIQFDGDNAFAIWHFLEDWDAYYCIDLHSTDRPIIETIEGEQETRKDDYVIKISKGKFLLRNPDIFNEQYQLIE